MDRIENLACQTITFGDTQRERFPAIFAHLAEAGYTGVEIGFRHIRAVPPTVLQEMLARNGLALVASHIGGNLEDRAQAEGEKTILEEIVEYLNAMDTRFLMFSGLRYQMDEQFTRDLEAYLRARDAAARGNVRMLYHNHDWEFQHDVKVMTALIREGVELCPDLGWVCKAGVDPQEFLKQTRSLVAAVHLKDFATTKPGVDTVCLGDGCVPLATSVRWVRENLGPLWLIAEQDRSNVTPEQATAANAAFVAKAQAQ